MGVASFWLALLQLGSTRPPWHTSADRLPLPLCASVPVCLIVLPEASWCPHEATCKQKPSSHLWNARLTAKRNSMAKEKTMTTTPWLQWALNLQAVNHPVDKGGRHVHHFALLSFPVCGNFIMIAFLSRNAEHIEFWPILGGFFPTTKWTFDEVFELVKILSCFCVCLHTLLKRLCLLLCSHPPRYLICMKIKKSCRFN